MNASLTRAMWCAVLGIGGIVGCRAPREPETFDRCDRYPPDSVPPPAIAVQASADSPGAVFVAARTSGRASSVNAILDQMGGIADSGHIRFSGVTPGPHRLRLRSFGYGERDTAINMPADSSLHVKVMLTKGGGIRGCSSYIIVKE